MQKWWRVAVFAGSFVLLTTYIVVGNVIEPFYPTGLAHVLSSTGGWIMTVDFVAALLLIAAWIAWDVKDWRWAIVWVALVVILGTPAALAYLVGRAWRAAHRE